MANGKRGAPLGNNNGGKNKEWSDAIRRAVARRLKLGKPGNLNDLADKLIDKVLEGDNQAIKEFGDRYEGKVANIIEGTGPGGAITIVTSKDDGSVL